jgi:hypothetical protein
MKAYVAMPVFPVLRPSVLKKDFKYERPAYERLPSRAECASMFGQIFEWLIPESN